MSAQRCDVSSASLRDTYIFDAKLWGCTTPRKITVKRQAEIASQVRDVGADIVANVGLIVMLQPRQIKNAAILMFGLDDAVAHVSALALANRTEYDLGNGVWTGDGH